MADGVPVMLLITVSRPRSESVLKNLLGACRRKTCDVSVFFTGRGVQLLEDNEVLHALGDIKEAVACADSWKASYQFDCPLTSGSQTDHSRLIGEAQHVVSL